MFTRFHPLDPRIRNALAHAKRPRFEPPRGLSLIIPQCPWPSGDTCRPHTLATRHTLFQLRPFISGFTGLTFVS